MQNENVQNEFSDKYCKQLLNIFKETKKISKMPLHP